MKKASEAELILMDAGFRRMRAIRAFESLRWTKRYYDDGEFELHLPHRFIDDALSAAYIYRNDRAETGVITAVTKDDDGITVTGGFLEQILKTRAFYPHKSREGFVHNVCRDIVSDCCITPAVRRIPRFALGKYDAIQRSVSVQQGAKTVAEALREILSEQEASYRVRYEIAEDTLYFDIYTGLDRTETQSANDWCVFSREYFNVLSASYELNADTRNFAYVIGETRTGSVSTPVVEEVSVIKAGDERRELYVEAKDIHKEDGMSDAAFRALLRDRGLQRLAEYNIGESIEFEVDITKLANVSFALGDKCTYRDAELGFTAEGRITEIDEVIESGEISMSVILGREQLSLVQKIRRGGN